MKDLLVMKFGGTSVSNSERIRAVAVLIAQYARKGPVVVAVSAISGITSKLLSVAHAIGQGLIAESRHAMRDIQKQHMDALRDLRLSSSEEEARVAKELDELCEVLFFRSRTLVPKTASPRDLDVIAGLGERLSARLIAGAVRNEGRQTQAVDSIDCIVTTADFGQAEVLYPETEIRTKERLQPFLEQGIIPVVTGYVGSTLEGEITTLGRNSSDYSAAVLAWALDAEKLIIWTDVDGVYTDDPNKNPQAFLLPEITYERALMMATYGAKVVYPKTLEPLMKKNIPLQVKNSFKPDLPGTKIWKGA